jgi:DNA-directed RNA polymerase delta subunit
MRNLNGQDLLVMLYTLVDRTWGLRSRTSVDDEADVANLKVV